MIITTWILFKKYKKDLRLAEQYFLQAVAKEHIYAMYNLARMYHTEFKDFQKAEQYYLLAVAKNDANAMNSLAWSYFQKKINKQKAMEFAERSFEKEKNIYTAHTYATVLIWNNQIKKAFEMSQEFITNLEALEKFPEDISLFLLLIGNMIFPMPHKKEK